MARPPSWLPRLHEIRRAVSGSMRSHYTRRELESLFQLQPRAALNLIELLPTVAIGTSFLVARDTLLGFLQGANDTDDITAYFEAVRAAKETISHRKIRSLVRQDQEPLSIASLPEAVHLSPGRLEITFATVEQLAEAMYALARVLDGDLENFARAFEVRAAEDALQEPDEMEQMFADLNRLAASYRVPSR